MEPTMQNPWLGLNTYTENDRLFGRDDHGGRGAGGEQHVRRDFLHDIVREHVDERALGAQFLQKGKKFGFGKDGHGGKGLTACPEAIRTKRKR